MRWIVIVVLFSVTFRVIPCQAERTPWVLTVADAYLELHTGPGRGYPVFHSLERDERLTVLKQRAGWYKVRTDNDISGWLPRLGLDKTTEADGRAVSIDEIDLRRLTEHRWRAGFSTGDFGGANVLSVFGGYVLSPNLSVELSVSQALGPFADSLIASASLVHQFAPERRITPFFSLTTGMIRTEPAATLVQTEDRSDQIAAAGVGVRAWITRRFVFRAEYRNYVVFTSRDDNQEINEWKAGFTFFF